jgi:hypothetical protein
LNDFRIPDFALGGLIAVILITFAVLSAFPSQFDSLVIWIPLLGFVLIAAAGVWIGSPQRKEFAVLLVSGVTGLVIAMQFVAQRAQIEEMRTEQRARVSINSIEVSSARKDINGLTLYLKYSVENSGKNPASNVHLNQKLYVWLTTGNVSTDHAEEMLLCEQSSKLSGFAVFPGQKRLQNITGWTLTQEDIDNWESYSHRKIEAVPITILGCLTYEDAVTQTWHGSPVAFLVTSETYGVPFDSQILTTTHLSIQPSPFGGEAPPF